ncbi:DUF3857 domain-containing protein [bacterium]|nr:DUF3857 domain-containing protein [bacterium]
MLRRRPCARAAVVCLALTAVLCPLSTLASTTSAGWDALWENRLVEAADLFAAADDPEATDALQGRLLAELALGRSLAAARTLLGYLDDLPRDPADVEIVRHALWNLDLEDRELIGDLARALAPLGRDDDLDTIDRRQALALQQSLFLAAGEVGEVEKLTRELNRVTDWGVIGPFDNTSGSGHGQTFVRRAAFDPLERFDGKFGQPVKWFRPDLMPPSGIVAPSHYFYQDEYTTSYVRTAVNIPEAGRYLLSLSFSGDVQVTLNDEVLADASTEISGHERLHWHVDLPRGWNRLAVKVSQREEGDAVGLALSHLDGSAIDDLEIAAGKNGMSVMREVTAEPVTGARHQAVVAAAEAHPDDPRLALWRLTLARRTMTPDELLEHCDGLDARFTDHAVLALAVADARQQAGQRSRHEQRMSRLAELAPELARPQIYLGFEDLKRRYASRALERARDVLDRAPDSAVAHRLKLQAYQQDRRWHDLKNAAEKAARRLPRESFPYFALAEWATEMGDRSAASDHREQAVERMGPSAANVRRLAESFDKEDFADARDMAERLTRLAPDSKQAWTLYVRALMADGEARKAAEELDVLLDSFPLNAVFIHLRALTILRGIDFDGEAFWRENPELIDALRRNRHLRNDKEVEREWAKAWRDIATARERAAAEILATALLVAPGDLDLRDQVRSWRGQKPYREFFDDLEADEIDELRVEPDAYAGHSTVRLHHVNRRFVFDGQASLLDETTVVQVLDQDGVEDWEVVDLGTYDRSRLTFVDYEVIKPDGAIEKGELFWGKIMFKGLAPGDIVHLRYQYPTIVTGKLAGNIWDQQLFAAPHSPTVEAVYELVLPRDMSIELRTWNDPESVAGRADQPVTVDIGENLNVRRWRYRDLPAYARDPGAADPRYYLPWVDVSTLDDWSVVARWFHDLASGQAEPDVEIRRRAAELCDGLTTDDEKIAAIYRFVANEITYESIPLYQSAYIPRRASTVLRDGFGDCKDKSCLMIAMARAEGIEDLDFALVTPNAPARPGYMPSPRFNHAIVARRSGLQDYRWFDPTLRMSEPGQVPRYLVGVPALVASRFGGELVIIDPADGPRRPTTTRTRLAIDGEGHAEVTRAIDVSQVDRVVGLRRALSGLGPDDLCSRLVRELATDFPGVRVDDREVAGLAPGADTVRVHERFTIPELVQWQPGFLSVTVPWRTQLREWSGVIVADQSRRSPINLRLLNVDETETIDLVLPPGKRLAAVPEGRSLESGHCRFETSYERTDGGLRIERRLVLDGSVVPLEKYDEFKAFLDQVRRDMNRPLNLRTS